MNSSQKTYLQNFAIPHILVYSRTILVNFTAQKINLNFFRFCSMISLYKLNMRSATCSQTFTLAHCNTMSECVTLQAVTLNTDSPYSNLATCYQTVTQLHCSTVTSISGSHDSQWPEKPYDILVSHSQNATRSNSLQFQGLGAMTYIY